MGRRRCLAALLGCLVGSGLAAERAQVAIEHVPVGCVPADRFPRIEARLTPPRGVRAAEVQFRAGRGGGWYSTPLKRQGDSWSAVLPRPKAGIGRIEYRIAASWQEAAASASASTTYRADGASDQAARVSPSPTYRVDVVSDPSACATTALLALQSTIEVRVPLGAPLVPAVPAGFDPVGVVAAQEREPGDSKKAGLLVAGALGAASVAGAFPATGTRPTPAPATPLSVDVPGFAFSGVSPATGGTIRLGSTSLQLTVAMSREPASPLDLDWRVEWRRQSGGGGQFSNPPSCAWMAGTLPGVQRPLTLVLGGSATASGACGASFDASFVRLWIRVAGQTVWYASLDLPFHFES